MSAARDRLGGSDAPLDMENVRAQFPALHQRVRGRPLVYLDNAATAHKPQVVLDTLQRCYAADYSNVHRGAHYLSERATAAFEQARDKVRAFINAAEAREIVFLRGTTEAINLVAQSWGRAGLGPGDEVLVSAMEHHSNIVPWQLVCAQTGARLRVIPVDDAGDLIMEEYARLLGPQTRLVAVTHVSNALGTINPLAEIIAAAHAQDALVLVDGAQAVPHMPVDVQALGCDFYAFSGHKAYGPTGIGALYGRAALLEAMPPWQGGGEMIRTVSFECTTYAPIPQKFEAGTPHIVGAIGLGAALDFLGGLDAAAVAVHEQALLARATAAAAEIPGLRLIGTARRKAGILSFVFDDIHAHDVGTILDHQGIAVRTGHHCAMPVMERYGVPATVRASFGVYNTAGEVDALMTGLRKVREVFGV